MGTFKVGLIRVLTTEDPEVLLAHGKTIMEHFPGIAVETKCIPDQYEGIHSDELCKIAIAKIVETALKPSQIPKPAPSAIIKSAKHLLHCLRKFVG